MSGGVILPILIGIAVLGLIGFSPYVAAQEETTLPEWFENNHTWLDNKQIDDELFLQAMQYLIDNDLIKTQKDSMTNKFASTVNKVISKNNLEGTEHFVHFAADSNDFPSSCEGTNSCLVPYTITINVGDHVTWHTEYGPNTISAGDLFVDSELVGEDYPNGFYSGFMPQHTTFTHQFDTQGTYPYFSFLHPWASGVVIVEPIMDTPQDKICDNETITSGIFKSISVTPNSICSIVNVEVIGDIRAENTIHLGVGHSTVGGNIIVNSIQSFDVGFSTINKSVKIDGATDYIQIFNVVIGKDLVIKNSSTLSSLDVDNNQILKNFEIKDNNYSQASDETRIVHNNISGDVKIKKNTNFADFLFGANQVGKNIRVVDNIGDANSDLNISSNQVLSGKLEIKKNVSDKIFSLGNTVGKDLKITKNNSDGVSVAFNAVDKKLDVSGHSDLDILDIENNVAHKIKIKDNHTNVRLWCGDNFPDPIMEKNTFAGLAINECKNYS